METSTYSAGEVSISATDATGIPFQVYRYYYERQIFATLAIMVSIIGIVGNTFVIAAVSLSRKLRTVTNVFVVNLSVSDLLSCVSLPWQAVAVLSEDGWPLPQAYWLCVMSIACTILSTGCSVTTLAMIAVNRWVGITKPIATTRRIYSRRHIACMVAFSWAYPLAVLTPMLVGFGELGYEPQYSTCSWVKANPWSRLQNIVVGVSGFPIQLTIIVLCYASIFRYVMKTSSRMARHDTKSVSGTVSRSDGAMRKKLWKRQIAVTKNLVYIVFAFVICMTPAYFSMIPLGYDWSIRMTPYAAAIVYCNSCLNPIIYATSHPDFKEVFGYMIRGKFKDIPQSRAQSRLANKA